jgi:hypothetical protein
MVDPIDVPLLPLCAGRRSCKSTRQYIFNMATGSVNAKTASDAREMAKNDSSRFMPRGYSTMLTWTYERVDAAARILKDRVELLTVCASTVRQQRIFKHSLLRAAQRTTPK